MTCNEKCNPPPCAIIIPQHLSNQVALFHLNVSVNMSHRVPLDISIRLVSAL